MPRCPFALPENITTRFAARVADVESMESRTSHGERPTAAERAMRDEIDRHATPVSLDVRKFAYDVR